MKTTNKPAPRRNVTVDFVSMQENTSGPDTRKALKRVAAIARAVNAVVRPRTFANTNTERNYAGHELKPYIGRPNAEQAQTLPSRVGSRLHYRDGLVTNLTGTVLSPSRSNA